MAPNGGGGGTTPSRDVWKSVGLIGVFEFPQQMEGVIGT